MQRLPVEAGRMDFYDPDQRHSNLQAITPAITITATSATKQPAATRLSGGFGGVQANKSITLKPPAGS
jgi:hypothetical protein